MRQLFVFRGQASLRVLNPLLGADLPVGPHVQRLGELRTLLAPGGELGPQFDMPVLQPLSGLFHVAKFGFVPGDF